MGSISLLRTGTPGHDSWHPERSPKGELEAVFLCHAAPKNKGIQRPLRPAATNETCRERSSVSDDLFVFLVAPNMAAKSPVNSIRR